MNDVNIDNLFPPDNPKPLTGVYRQNALRRLRAELCPLCGAVGDFQLFNKAMHVGVRCAACNKEHPLRSRGVMWLADAMNAWKRGRS
jgi:hypothetical protein